MMLDRRDFDEWWARETARSGVTNGFVAKHWAEAGFFAAQDLIRQQARRVSTSGYVQTVPALLKGASHDR